MILCRFCKTPAMPSKSQNNLNYKLHKFLLLHLFNNNRKIKILNIFKKICKHLSSPFKKHKLSIKNNYPRVNKLFNMMEKKIWMILWLFYQILDIKINPNKKKINNKFSSKQ